MKGPRKDNEITKQILRSPLVGPCFGSHNERSEPWAFNCRFRIVDCGLVI